MTTGQALGDGVMLVTGRPYVVLSCAMSVDGCLDDCGEDRLVLSGPADLDRVDGERAAADAIMAGAGTIRRDDPGLLVRSPQRQAARLARGLPAHPAAVTLTASGDLDPGARFLAPAGESSRNASGGHGPGAPARLVYCASPVAGHLRQRLHGLAEVIDAGERPALARVLADLSARGVRRLLVEGGAVLGRGLLADGLVDEMHLVIAPFFVGDPAAPRFAGPARYPHGSSNPMSLAGVTPVGEVVLLRYLLTQDRSRRGGRAPGGAAAGRPQGRRG